MTETATPTTAVAQQQAANIATKPMSIKDTVLAQFKETEAGLLAMAEKYRNVVYDVTTTKGMNEAKAARAELRDDGRRMLTRTEAAVKADVNELKKVMGDEVERLVAIVKPVEDAIDAQIKAEEKRKADEKAERERKEAERVGAHRANIDQLKAYVEQAEGQPVDVIEKAIATLGEMTFGEEWEEFAQEAEAACLATVQRLLPASPRSLPHMPRRWHCPWFKGPVPGWRSSVGHVSTGGRSAALHLAAEAATGKAMKRTIKTLHILYGGPDRRIKDATGKVWRFEMHPYSGPAVQDARGELAEKQPGERSPFWTAVTLWAQQGAVIGPDGLCTWKPEPETTPVHLSGRNYAIAGSGLAEKYGRNTP